MNDHLNDNLTPDDALSAEELALLKDVLDSAWPPPKHSVRDSVMAQIRRERMAEKRRILRNRFLRYGSLAACLLLVTAAGFRILPALTQKSADMAAVQTASVYTDDAADAVTEEAVTEAAVTSDAVTSDRENGGIVYSTFAAPQSTEAETSAPAETRPETEPASKLMFAAAPTAGSTDNAECEAEDAAEEASPCETYRETLAADSIACAHSGVFADSYHTIPEVIIACTGEDVYLAWLDITDGCTRNIAHYLNYMEENSAALMSDIEMIYDATDLWYRYDWDFGLFSSGDPDAVEEYYQNGGDFAAMVKRDTEYRFKLALLDETGAEMNVDVCAWSIADLVESENITLAALTEIYESSAGAVEEAYPGYAPQQYDLAALHDYAFSEENDREVPPGSIAAGRHEDERFRIESDAVK